MQRFDSSSPAPAAPIVSTAGFDGENPLRRFRRLCVADVLARFTAQTSGEDVTVMNVPLFDGVDGAAREGWAAAAIDAVTALPEHRLAVVGDRLVLSAEDLYPAVLGVNGRRGSEVPEAVIAAQRVALGGSRGASVRFERVDGGEAVEVFTTRPDTIFGATFLAVSAAHPVVASADPALPAEFRALCQGAADAGDGADAKIGVPLGISLRNPLSPELELPVWLANFIVEGYGTGAAGGCPACDQRDLDFARRYGLPVVSIVCPPDEDPATYEVGASAHPGDGTIINSGFLSGLPVAEAKQAAIAHLVTTGRGRPAVQYRRQPMAVAQPAADDAETDIRLLGRSWRLTPRFLTAAGLAVTEQGAKGPGHAIHVTVPEAASRQLLDARILSCALAEARGREHSEPWQDLILVGDMLGSSEAEPSGFELPGTDAARMAVLSDVPPDRDAEWSDRKLVTSARFVEGVEALLRASTDTDTDTGDTRGTGTGDTRGTGSVDVAHIASTVAQAATNLGNALRRGRVNTALAAAREIVGQAGKQTASTALDPSARTYIASLLYSLLPTTTAETLGGAAAPPAWPQIPELRQEAALLELVVQINGKKRGTVRVAADADEAAVIAAVRSDEPLQSHLGDAPPRKVVFVPGRLVNLVL